MVRIEKKFENVEYWDAFSRIYDNLDGKHTNDIDFYVNLARQYMHSGRILEIACGTGRITTKCAEIGASMLGIDFSKNMIKMLINKIKGTDLESRIQFLVGDMRNFFLNARFKLIICPFRALNCLATPEDRLNAFKSIYMHLHEDGLFVFNVFYPKNVFLNQEQLKKMEKIEDAPVKDDMKIVYNNHITDDLSVITKNLEYELLFPKDIIFYGNLEVKFYRIEKEELEHLLTLANFSKVEIFESFKKEITNPDTKDYVVFAQK